MEPREVIIDENYHWLVLAAFAIIVMIIGAMALRPPPPASSPAPPPTPWLWVDPAPNGGEMYVCYAPCTISQPYQKPSPKP